MDDNLEQLKIDLTRVNYLAFQGGGGKGITYLGALEILETIESGENTLLPLKLPISKDEADRVPGNGQGLIGISGASAGAITAYLVALGLDSDDIRNESGFAPPRKKFPNDPISEEYLDGESTSGFDFNDFFVKDKPEPGKRRAILSDTNKVNVLGFAVDEMIGAKTNKAAKKDLQNKIVSYGLQIASPNLSLNIPGIGDIYELVNYADKKSLESTLNGILKDQFKDNKSGYYQPAAFNSVANVKVIDIQIEKLNKAKEKEFGPVSRTLVTAGYAKIGKGLRESNNKIVSTIGKSEDLFFTHLYNLIYEMGLFPGFSPRDFFIDVTFRRLPVKLGWSEEEKEALKWSKEKASTMTFREFYKYTGVDLVVSGVNLTTTKQHSFSKKNTPDFPVIGAIEISMNIPALFKPIYVNAVINNDLPIEEGRKLQQEYRGLWVDGGLALNIPFHAYDDDVKLIKGVNPHMLGLMLIEGPDPHPNLFNVKDPFFYQLKEANGRRLYKEYVDRLLFDAKHPELPHENYKHLVPDGIGVPAMQGTLPIKTNLVSMLVSMLNTFLNNNTENQLSEATAKQQVISLYTYHIGITDFKADESLTEFVLNRARARTKYLLGIENEVENPRQYT